MTHLFRPMHVSVLLRFAGTIAALALLCLVCAAPAGEPAAPPQTPPVTPKTGGDAPKAGKEDAALPEVDWKADKQSFVEDKGALVLSGSAWVRYKGTKLEADKIVFFRQSREVYAEGNIRLHVGESEIAAQVAYVDFTNDTGYMVEATVRVSAPPNALKDRDREKPDEKYLPASVRTRDPFGTYLDVADDPQARLNLIFKAQKLIQHSRMMYSAEDAYITTDDMVHPMYGARAGELSFYLREVPNAKSPGTTELKPQKVTVKRGRLEILGFALFPFPTVTYDMTKRNIFFQSHVGNSKRWGPFALNRIGYNLTAGENKVFDPTRVYLDLDARADRGPAAGFEFDWQTGLRPPEAANEKEKFERGQGHFRIYALDEFQTSEQDDLARARRNLERRIQPKIDGFPRRSFDANLLFLKRRKLDDAGPPSFDLETHRDDWRGTMDFQHHQPLRRFAGIDNLQLDLRYQRQSDRDFMLEYFPRDYITNNQPEALASLRKPGDNYSIELLYRTSPQDFDGAPPRSPYNYGTFTDYEPALTYSLVPTPLPYGFNLTTELQAARMRREFERKIWDQPGFESGRAYGIVDLSRPFKWGIFNFVPHLGTQQQAYDNSRDGASVFQGAMTYGLDITTRAYGTFNDFENDALGLQGLRHIIEPRFSYRGIGDTRESPDNILDFDEIDDLTRVDRMTFALDQTFQTKRPTKGGGTHAVNFAGFDMAVDVYPRSRDQDRLLQGDAFDLFRMNGYLRVVDVLKVDGALGFSLEDGKLEKAVYGFTIDPQGRWRLRFEERFNFGSDPRKIAGSDQYHLKFEYRLSERWLFSFENISEARKSLLARKGRQVERIALTRNYGPLDATFTYAIDNNLGEHSFFVSARPVYTYRNLVVPTQDLLVGEGEVAGESDTPEERNFDPFDLLRQRRKKGTQPSGKSSPSPSPRQPDLPIPPTPAPDKRADGSTGNSDGNIFRDPDQRSADVFRDPTEAKRPARSKKVDEDDWTAPATPASTRQQ